MRRSLHHFGSGDSGLTGKAPPSGPVQKGQGQMLSNMIRRFVRDERGMETVEWGVLAALIVAGLVAVIAGLGSNVLGKFQTLQTATN